MTGVADLVPYLAGALFAGGIAVGLSRRREYMLRWCAWAVGVPVVVAALYVGPGGAAALAASAGVACALEYGGLAGLSRLDRAALATAVPVAPVTAWLAPDHLPQVLALTLVAVAMVPVLAGDAAGGLSRLCSGVLGVVWFAPLAGVVLLGPQVLALFAAVSIADITASVGGRSLGGPALSRLSPSKHWSGLLAGTVTGLGTLAVLGAFTPAWAVAVAVGAPLGDLLESMVKRGVEAKDSASWLAGAGGLLDRLDSLLLVLVLALALG
ncbi:phosphatidate cytidylyltransferase [Actinomadura luteofluorescens]|uniref:Phosphatidate cytidylyltransferase n=1 Tax=Actinomadura luteofluorescens TaxID=46163 RepID=A0A7Y9EGF6_9ACTN|nr:phosphatidate cytidylyltransferase [Actinomadura luteofluorescens]NYD47147.1 phosphatidate cytidylyltransferase [Actinomadura luteofluorescens]